LAEREESQVIAEHGLMVRWRPAPSGCLEEQRQAGGAGPGEDMTDVHEAQILASDQHANFLACFPDRAFWQGLAGLQMASG
jgi:hypothetical protein